MEAAILGAVLSAVSPAVVVTPIYGDPGNCPGGGPIYTDDDLSEYVGRVVTLDDGLCYYVIIDGESSDGSVMIVNDYGTCNECCGT